MGKTVLVVDDDPDIAEILSISLNHAGFTTHVAHDGQAALQRVQAHSPDLVILDVMLPGMDGFAVCEHLRRDPATTAIPIIMLTGMPGELPRFAGIESGATEYLNKPISPEHLVARVQSLLNRTSPASDA